MKTPRSLILLASAHELRLLGKAGDNEDLVELAYAGKADFSDVDFQFRDQAPREGGGGLSGQPHVINPRQTEREKERERMARHASHLLTDRWRRGGYDRIVIAAPEKMLGLLRNSIPSDLLPHIAASLDKDIVKIVLKDLPAHLRDAVRFRD